MKKMITVIKKLSGRVVGYGIDDDNLIKAIEKNDNIYECDLLNSNYSSEIEGVGKTKYISDIKKKYKKNKVDYTIINVDNLDPYYLKIISDSIYITKEQIILYYQEKEQNYLIKRYKRYNVIVEEEKNIVKIDVKGVKTNKIKDFIFYIIDFIKLISDKIGDIMN